MGPKHYIVLPVPKQASTDSTSPGPAFVHFEKEKSKSAEQEPEVLSPAEYHP